LTNFYIRRTVRLIQFFGANVETFHIFSHLFTSTGQSGPIQFFGANPVKRYIFLQLFAAWRIVKVCKTLPKLASDADRWHGKEFHEKRF
jgi:hypothetical protein